MSITRVWIVLHWFHSLRLMVFASKALIFFRVLAMHTTFRPSETPLQILGERPNVIFLASLVPSPPGVYR